MLLGPAASQLETKRLVVVADGALQYISFSALPDPAPGYDSTAPLMLRHEITCQPSASALAVLRDKINNRQPASNVLAVFADPVFEKDDPRLSTGMVTPTVAASVQTRGTEV